MAGPSFQQRGGQGRERGRGRGRGLVREPSNGRRADMSRKFSVISQIQSGSRRLERPSQRQLQVVDKLNNEVAPPYRGRSSSFSSSTTNHSSNNDLQHHPFFISSNTILSPRADVWLFLFLSSCASTASLSVDSQAVWRSTAERVALAAMGSSTVLTLGVAVAFRYRPSRSYMTARVGRRGGSSSITLEFGLSIALLSLNLIAIVLVFQPSRNMAVSLSEIWNTNLFFATWISASLSSYLVADLLTVRHVSGLVPKECSLVMGNAIARGWILLFIGTLSLLVFSLSLRLGPSCSDALMMETSSACQMTIVGIIISGLGMLLPGGYLTISLLERKNDATNLSLNNRYGGQKKTLPTSTTPFSAPPATESKRNLISTVLSVTSLIFYSINAAFMTSPGPSQELMMGEQQPPANIYFSSWICFALSLYLCIRHVEVYFVPGSQRLVTDAAFQSLSSSMYPSTKKNIPPQRRLIRSSSKNSQGSTALQSLYSDEEIDMTPGGYDTSEEQLKIAPIAPMGHQHDADSVLKGMVDSHSEDGPMVFLPLGAGMGGISYASDIDDDASYPSAHVPPPPSVSPKISYPPPVAQNRQPPDRGAFVSMSMASASQMIGREPHKPRSVNPSGHFQAATASSRSPHNGREPHKPRSVNPSGRFQAATASSRGSHVANSRAQVEPPDIDAAKMEGDLYGASMPSVGADPHGVSNPSVGDIDYKFQASSGSDRSRRSRKNRGSAQRNQNPDGHHRGGGANTTGNLYVEEQQLLEENQHISQKGFHMETVSSESGSEWTPSPDTNPLDRSTRPGLRAMPQQQQQQRPRGKDPSFRAAPPQRMESLDNFAMTSISDTSVARTDHGSKATTISTKTKSKSSSSKSRSNSQKKRRSKSRDRGSGSGDKRKGKYKSKSPSRNSKQGYSMRSASAGSQGLLTVSNSSGPGGPPTMSASEGSSLPSTNEGNMGHVGPQQISPLGSLNTQDGVDTRPVKTIDGSMDNMSMVSDPTMDGFGPPEDYDNLNRVHHASKSRPPEFRSSTEALDGQRYSHAHQKSNSMDSSSDSTASSQTNSNNDFRQGAVDKMVMEALRQAQETRQVGTHHPDLGPRQMSHTSNLQRLPPPTRIGRGRNQGGQVSQTSRGNSRNSRASHSLHSTQGSKSNYSKKQQMSLPHAGKRNGKAASSGSGEKSGSSLRHGQVESIHSFYSHSEAQSLDIGDAFAC